MKLLHETWPKSPGLQGFWLRMKKKISQWHIQLPYRSFLWEILLLSGGKPPRPRQSYAPWAMLNLTTTIAAEQDFFNEGCQTLWFSRRKHKVLWRHQRETLWYSVKPQTNVQKYTTERVEFWTEVRDSKLRIVMSDIPEYKLTWKRIRLPTTIKKSKHVSIAQVQTPNIVTICLKSRKMKCKKEHHTSTPSKWAYQHLEIENWKRQRCLYSIRASPFSNE